MKTKACVRGGVCCKKGPCAFGEYDFKIKQCVHLVEEIGGLHACGIYDEIIKHPHAKFDPAMGSGCCMSLFNEAREVIIDKHYSGIIPMVEIEDF